MARGPLSAPFFQVLVRSYGTGTTAAAAVESPNGAPTIGGGFAQLVAARAYRLEIAVNVVQAVAQRLDVPRQALALEIQLHGVERVRFVQLRVAICGDDHHALPQGLAGQVTQHG